MGGLYGVDVDYFILNVPVFTPPPLPQFSQWLIQEIISKSQREYLRHFNPNFNLNLQIH